MHPLPADILNLQPPFLELEKVNTALSINASWNDVPLYTHYCNGAVPVMLHHNGDKGARDSKWNEMWYYPYAQAMFNIQPPRQAESLVMGKVGKETLGPGSAFDDKGGIVDFQKVCEGWDFR